MALAPYFRRSAVAAAQVVAGYSEEAIRERLEGTTIGIAIGVDTESPQGEALVDLTVRLVSRLYPRLIFSAGTDLERWVELAKNINPEVSIVEGKPTFTVALGNAKPVGDQVLFLGCDDWEALVSRNEPQQIGKNENPFGAGVAACVGLANIFRFVFVNDGPQLLDEDVRLSALTLERGPTLNPPIESTKLDESVLVGAGAVGNAAVWALARTPATGTINLVDHEDLELDNLQRYVLATVSDEGKTKVDIAAKFFTGGIKALPHRQTWGQFTEANGYMWRRVLVAVDTAATRREVQSALPAWLGNAWTQPGDLGVSVHPHLEAGACLSCLYLPKGEVPSEDKLVATALGLTSQEHEMLIRVALFNNQPLPTELVDPVAENLGIPRDLVLSFENRSVRDLYREGLCGGALLPLERLGQPAQDVHVPLAHQSALAGVLLGARLVASALGLDPASTSVAQIDVLRPLTEFPQHPVEKDSRGICMCQDEDYRRVYKAKCESLA